jgi:hypothetical protein
MFFCWIFLVRSYVTQICSAAYSMKISYQLVRPLQVPALGPENKMQNIISGYDIVNSLKVVIIRYHLSVNH